MVHGQSRVGVLQVFRGVERIGGQRADQLQPLCAQQIERRADDVQLFTPLNGRLHPRGV